jgi:hypothetical protein
LHLLVSRVLPFKWQVQQTLLLKLVSELCEIENNHVVRCQISQFQYCYRQNFLVHIVHNNQRQCHPVILW